jgi:tRNA pseudouridine55 synthase
VTGDILEERPVACSPHDIAGTLQGFRGLQFQVPPMYSALKQGGQPLYKLARRGEEVERQSRPVQIEELTLSDVRAEEVDLRVECSKGTYIRVLAEDIGTALGCGATLKRLRRTRVGGFRVDSAFVLEALERMTPAQRDAILLPMEAGLEDVPRLSLSESQLVRIFRGQLVDVGSAGIGEGIVRLYVQCSGKFVGLGFASQANVRPLRLVAAERFDNR